mgnify:CR=1 FL=1
MIHLSIALIRICRLRWAEHVQRMDINEITEKVMQLRPEGKRSVGRSILSWMDRVVEDVRKLGIQNWWKIAEDRHN